MPMNCGACNFGARTRRVFASTSTPIPTTKHSSQAQRKSTLNTWLPHMASLRGRVEQHEDITMPSLRQRCVRTFNAVSYLGNVRRYIVDLPPYRDSSMDLKYLTHVAAGFYPACLCHDGLYRFSKAVRCAPRRGWANFLRTLHRWHQSSAGLGAHYVPPPGAFVPSASQSIDSSPGAPLESQASRVVSAGLGEALHRLLVCPRVHVQTSVPVLSSIAGVWPSLPIRARRLS